MLLLWVWHRKREREREREREGGIDTPENTKTNTRNCTKRGLSLDINGGHRPCSTGRDPKPDFKFLPSQLRALTNPRCLFTQLLAGIAQHPEHTKGLQSL